MSLFAAAVAWLLCAGAHALGVPPAPVAPLAAFLTAALPSRTWRGRALHVTVALAVFGIAVVRLNTNRALPADSVGRRTDQPVRLLLRADADGEVHPTYVSATAVALARAENGEWVPASGRVNLLLPAATMVGEGDRLDVTGRLAPPGEGNSGYASWLRRRGVVASLAFPRLTVLQHGSPGRLAALWKAFRRRAEGNLEHALPPEEAALGASLLFGNHHALPAELNADLQGSGLSHIAVVSAFKVILLYGIVVALFAPIIGRRRAVVLAVVLAVGYGAAAGDSATLRRGELLVLLLALAAVSGRPYNRLWLLVLAAAAMTVTDPALVSDAGFQLTFAAAGGITLLAPLITTAVERVIRCDDGVASLPAHARVPAEAAIISLSVTLAIVPISLAAFGSISLTGIAANAVVNPLLPLGTLLTLLTGLFGTLPAAAALGAPAWLVLRYVEDVAHLAAHSPGATVGLPLSPVPFALCWYATLLALVLGSGRLFDRIPRPLRRHAPRRQARPSPAVKLPVRPLLLPTVALCSVLIVTPAVAASLRAGMPAATSVRWLDGTDGAAALVTGRNGVRVLVTSTNAPLALAQALQRSTGNMPRIDLLVVAEAGAGAGGRSEAAKAVRAGAVLVPGATPESVAGESTSQTNGVFTVHGRAEVQLGGGDLLAVFTSGRDVVVRITFGRQVLLLAGARFAGALALWQQPVGADLIVLPERNAAGDYRELLDASPAALVLSGHEAVAFGRHVSEGACPARRRGTGSACHPAW